MPHRLHVLAAALLAGAVSLPVAALGQSTGTTVDGAVPAAPPGHLQPNAASSPDTAAPNANSGGIEAVDPASATQKRLESSDKSAVDSICADCLPKGTKTGKPVN